MNRAMLRAWLGLPLLVLSGCHPIDVTVASAGASFEGGAGSVCASNRDCLPEEFCSKNMCGDLSGLCQMRPPSCQDDYEAVCGCDGVVYWNDCLRKRDAVPSSTQGPCLGDDPFHVCGGQEDAGCPVDDAYCNKLIVGPNNDCELPSEGVCWVLPDECPTEGVPTKWAECNHAPVSCVSQCNAIRTGRAYRLESMQCE